MDTVETAKFLGVTSRTIRNWIRKGVFRGVVVQKVVQKGRVLYRYLIPRVEVLRVFNQLVQGAVNRGELPREAIPSQQNQGAPPWAQMTFNPPWARASQSQGGAQSVPQWMRDFM